MLSVDCVVDFLHTGYSVVWVDWGLVRGVGGRNLQDIGCSTLLVDCVWQKSAGHKVFNGYSGLLGRNLCTQKPYSVMANVLNKVPHFDSVLPQHWGAREGEGAKGGGGEWEGEKMVYSLPAAAACLGFAFPFSPALALDLSSTAPNRKSLQHQQSLSCIGGHCPQTLASTILLITFI